LKKPEFPSAQNSSAHCPSWENVGVELLRLKEDSSTDLLFGDQLIYRQQEAALLKVRSLPDG
jgi:hypothetical protein